MPGVQKSLGADGVTPAPWASLIGQINSAGKIAAGVATQSSRFTLDAWQNCTAITANNLSQTVTIGAGWFTTTATVSDTSPVLTSVASVVGFEDGMRVNGAGIPIDTNILSFTSSTVTLSQTPTAGASGVTITVGPSGGVLVTTGLTGSGVATPSNFAYSSGSTTYSPPPAPASYSLTVLSATGFAIGQRIGCWPEAFPACSITNVSGTTITLSSAVTETATGIYVAACNWTSLGGSVSP